MKFIAGLIIGVILVLLIPVFLIATGMFSMAALGKPGEMEEKIANWAWQQSAKKFAPTTKNPNPIDAATLDAGMDHYKDNCVICHGAPGVESGEIGKGLNPPAPMLDNPTVQRMTDGELFWTVKNGIRMTGMPAFGPTHSDEEIWKIVTFVRHLSQLTEKERDELKEATKEEEHHHEGEDEEGHTHGEESEHHHDKPHTHPQPHSH